MVRTTVTGRTVASALLLGAQKGRERCRSDADAVSRAMATTRQLKATPNPRLRMLEFGAAILVRYATEILAMLGRKGRALSCTRLSTLSPKKPEAMM